MKWFYSPVFYPRVALSSGKNAHVLRVRSAFKPNRRLASEQNLAVLKPVLILLLIKQFGRMDILKAPLSNRSTPCSRT
jgi:hypothetical protein